MICVVDHGLVSRKDKGSRNDGSIYYVVAIQYMGGTLEFYPDDLEEFGRFPDVGAEVSLSVKASVNKKGMFQVNGVPEFAEPNVIKVGRGRTAPAGSAS